VPKSSKYWGFHKSIIAHQSCFLHELTYLLNAGFFFINRDRGMEGINEIGGCKFLGIGGKGKFFEALLGSENSTGNTVELKLKGGFNRTNN
jgi:hypothetical protein